MDQALMRLTNWMRQMDQPVSGKQSSAHGEASRPVCGGSSLEG